MAESCARKRIALFYRYSVHDHAELYPIIPRVLKELGKRYDVWYIGAKSAKAGQYASQGVRFGFFPWGVDRESTRDKWIKSFLHYLAIPFWGLRLRLWRADLIWIDESMPLVTRLLQLFSGRPVTMTVIDFFIEIYRKRHRWLRAVASIAAPMDQKAWRKSCGLMTRTASMKHYLVGKGICADKIRIVRDAVIPDLFVPKEASELRAELGFAADDVVVCHHGILHPNKVIPKVLSWMIPVMEKDRRLKFLVVGGGPDMKALQSIVKERDMGGQVVFTGWLPSHKEVSMHLNASDIGLVMRVGQYSDHFHVTGALIHCMMCGLPVLSARLRGIEEIVTEGEEGCLFEPEAESEFRSKLEILAADAPLRKEMGDKGRARAVAEFDVDKVTADTVATLESFMGSAGPSGSTE